MQGKGKKSWEKPPSPPIGGELEVGSEDTT